MLLAAKLAITGEVAAASRAILHFHLAFQLSETLTMQ